MAATTFYNYAVKNILHWEFVWLVMAYLHLVI